MSPLLIVHAARHQGKSTFFCNCIQAKSSNMKDSMDIEDKAPVASTEKVKAKRAHDWSILDESEDESNPDKDMHVHKKPVSDGILH